MELVEVNSSNIKKVGYDKDSLLVEYLNGNKYKYLEVPKEKYEDLLKSESKGGYINREVKGKYLYYKIGD